MVYKVYIITVLNIISIYYLSIFDLLLLVWFVFLLWLAATNQQNQPQIWRQAIVFAFDWPANLNLRQIKCKTMPQQPPSKQSILNHL